MIVHRSRPLSPALDSTLSYLYSTQQQVVFTLVILIRLYCPREIPNGNKTADKDEAKTRCSLGCRITEANFIPLKPLNVGISSRRCYFYGKNFP